MDLSSGTQFGHYQLFGKIGSGGMGEVYRAMDTRLQREVAIKFVSESYLTGDGSSGTPGSPAAGTPHSRAHLSHERFLREARASATLNHPNICAIYDTGEEEGRPYLVMELLHGSNLKDVLKDGPLSPQEAVSFSIQAASALAAAHAKGIVHRDIKPANLFVVEPARGKRQIKILDFGLAKRQGTEASPDSRTAQTFASTQIGETAGLDLTTPGSTVGTVAYMSPEQAKGDPLDARTDLFSLGAVIYEMATGEKAFAGKSTAEVFAALLMKDPAAVSSVNPAMPRELDPIVSKLLAKPLLQRYQSAENLLGDLEEIGASASSGSGRVAAAATMPAVAEAEKPKSKIVPLIGALVAVVALLTGGWFLMHRNHAEAPGATADRDANAPANGKDAIILADFVNQTGDPVFDTTLNQALAVQLAQSPVLNLVSQQHLRQSLQFLGKKQDEIITPAIAREIGEREGIKAIITGTIVPIGHDYVITLTAQNTATGDTIASIQATAHGKEQVLEALNTTSAQMRSRLGESLSSIQRLNAPYGQATTPSLEAFRAYALGDLEHEKGNDIPDGEGHYKRALELDPNLAMAWARLGVIYLNSGQAGKSIEYFTKAYSLRGNVSERERLYIEGHYYSEVTGETDKAIETLELAVQEYPLQIDNFINLGVLYADTGQLQKNLATTLKAETLQPDDAITLGNLVGSYVQLDDYTNAQKFAAKSRQLGLVGIGNLTAEFQLAATVNDRVGMQRTMSMEAGKPDEFVMTGILGQWNAIQGKIGAAEAAYRKAAEQAGVSRAKDAQASALISSSSAGWAVGRCKDVEGTIRQAFQLDKSKPTMENAAWAAALCNNPKVAGPLLDDLEKTYPQDTLIQKMYVPQARGALALWSGKSEEALDFFERSRQFELVTPAGYFLGMAHLQMHDAQGAISAFQTATHYKGAAYASGGASLSFPTGMQYGLSLLQLGRAYAMAGDKAHAKQAYDGFFAEWKEADPDLPVLADAKKEFAAL